MLVICIYLLKIRYVINGKEENKKHLNCCYYDSAVHFGFEGIEIEVAAIIFFSVEKLKKHNTCH